MSIHTDAMKTLAKSEVVVACGALSDSHLLGDAVDALMTMLLNQSSNRQAHPSAVLKLTAEIITIKNGI